MKDPDALSNCGKMIEELISCSFPSGNSKSNAKQSCKINNEGVTKNVEIHFQTVFLL